MKSGDVVAIRHRARGLWGQFATAVEGRRGLGEKAAISALEQGEDHGRDD